MFPKVQSQAHQPKDVMNDDRSSLDVNSIEGSMEATTHMFLLRLKILDSSEEKKDNSTCEDHILVYPPID